MSSNFAILGLAMGAAGLLTDAVGARWVFVGAAGAVFAAGGVAAVMTRWLPTRREDEQEVLESQAAAALSGFARKKEGVGFAPRPNPPVQTDGKPKGGLERIATLLEEIEARRDLEARRPTAD
jgi:hypothetical protein